VYAEERGHQAANRARYLVAVKIEICVTLHYGPGKITLHAVKERADRINRKGGSTALEVNEDRQFITIRAADLTGVDPGANGGDALLGVGALRGSTRRFHIDKIIKAEVLRKRDHAYVPKTLPDPKS
jgi:hypothetical protein